jgi:hypothetical protein
MIVSVNGKRVGGMTAAGFEIEVEISGPELVLLVSRYKFATKVQDRIQEAERSYLDAIDKVINDDRLLGWTDIGTTTTPLSGPEMSANLDAAVASPSAITKPKVSPLTINARDENGFSSDESVELVKTTPNCFEALADVLPRTHRRSSTRLANVLPHTRRRNPTNWLNLKRISGYQKQRRGLFRSRKQYPKMEPKNALIHGCRSRTPYL